MLGKSTRPRQSHFRREENRGSKADVPSWRQNAPILHRSDRPPVSNSTGYSSKKGARFDIQINGAADFSITSYRMFIDCTHVEINRVPAANARLILSKYLPGTDCPVIHLLLFSNDGLKAHFCLDGVEIAASDMKGDATAVNISL